MSACIVAFPVPTRPEPVESFPPPAPPVLDSDDVARIRRLRRVVEQSLLASRSRLEHTCLIIAADRKASLQRYGLALFGTLDRHASQRLTFYPEGCKEFSGGEIWLSRVLRAFEQADTAEGRALIAWRVKPSGRRRVRFLVAGLADAFAALEAHGGVSHARAANH